MAYTQCNSFTQSPSGRPSAEVRRAINELRLQLSDYQIVCIIIFIPARFVECQAGFNNEYVFSLFVVDSWSSVNSTIAIKLYSYGAVAARFVGVVAFARSDAYRIELKPN